MKQPVWGNIMELPRGTLVEFLQKDIVEVDFTKVDGAPRKMNCTLDKERIPVQNITSESNRKQNPDVLVVWDLDKSAWRSFRFDSVNRFESHTFKWNKENEFFKGRAM
jgi:hypothetical protein